MLHAITYDSYFKKWTKKGMYIYVICVVDEWKFSEFTPRGGVNFQFPTKFFDFRRHGGNYFREKCRRWKPARHKMMFCRKKYAKKPAKINRRDIRNGLRLINLIIYIGYWCLLVFLAKGYWCLFKFLKLSSLHLVSKTLGKW